MARTPLSLFACSAAVLVTFALAACGEDEDGGGAASGQGPVHVHGLGINPADGALYIATHTGLFRSPQGADIADRVGDSEQDTMGFTVTGPDRFLGSGHPGPGEDGPPNLGLIESTDAGENWEQVSLGGEADFHVLRSAQNRVYGFNGLTGELLISDDGGESWDSRAPPGPMIDLAIDPEDPERLVASTGRGLAFSNDDGESWRSLAREVGLLAWPTAERFYLVNGAGAVKASDDAGESWSGVGRIRTQPAAFAAENADELYVARHDGTILESLDGGASWSVRSRP